MKLNFFKKHIKPMSEFTTRRRSLGSHTEEKADRLLLHEELVILLGKKRTILIGPDTLSICLRICIVAELILDDFICLNDDGKVKVKKSGAPNDLLQKTLENIGKTDADFKKVIRFLNGENFRPGKKLQLKKLRESVYKGLEEKKLISVKWNFYYADVQAIDNKLYVELYEKILNYLTERAKCNLRMDVLTCCIHFSGGIAAITNAVSLDKKYACESRTNELIGNYKTYYKRVSTHEDCIAKLLKCLLS